MANKQKIVQENLKLIEAFESERKRSVALLQRIARMVGNESTLDKSTLNYIDGSINNLQNIRQLANKNSSTLNGVSEPMVEWTTLLINQYKHTKELHYIHGTRTGAVKRKESSEYIQENMDIEAIQESTKRLTQEMDEFNPSEHIHNIESEYSNTNNKSSYECPNCGREHGLKNTASCSCGYIPPENRY